MLEPRILVVLPILFVLVLTSVIHGQPIRLELWHGITAADYAGLESIIRAFNEAYAGKYEVVDTMAGWDAHYERLQVATAAGIAPDLTYVHRDRLLEMVNKNILRPLDDLWNEAGWTEEHFIPGIAKAMEVNGVRYAVPIDVYSYLLFYNADHLNESGIAEPPTDPHTFIEASRKVLRQNGTEVVRWGTKAPNSIAYFFSYVWQNGGNYFVDDTYRQAALNTPEVLKALEFVYDMVFTHRIAPPLPQQPWVFNDTATFTIDGIWSLTVAQEERASGMRNIQVASADGLFGEVRKGIRVGSHTLAIPRRSAEDPERLEAAKTFIRFMSDNNIVWARHGQLPVRMDAITSEEFQNMTDHLAIARQTMVYLPNPPYLSQTSSVVGTLLQQTLNPSRADFMAPTSALLVAQEALQNRINEYFANP